MIRFMKGPEPMITPSRGMFIRLLFMITALGLAWGAATQLLLELANRVPILNSSIYDWALFAVSLLFFLVVLWFVARDCAPLATGALGGIFCLSAIAGYFACYIVVLGIGFGPAGTQWTVAPYDPLSYLWVFFKQTVLRWFLPAAIGGFIIGIAWSAVLVKLHVARRLQT